MDQMPFGTDDFAENPEPRVPCVLLLDTSYSMDGSPIQQLNEGLRAYKEELASDSLASKRVEVSIVTFGGEVNTVVDFTTGNNFEPPTLRADGHTPMGEAINAAIDMLEARKSQYRENAIAYYRPWIFLITDGAPSDEDAYRRAAERAKAGEQSKSFAFFAVGVKDADFATLSECCVRKPVKLEGLKFRELFLWLSSSQQSVSRSTPGDEVPLPTPEGWASV